MSHYIKMLKAGDEQSRTEKMEAAEVRRATEADAARERLTPLDDRLKRQLSTVPLEVQLEGLSLASLQVMLRGRWRGAAQAGQVGRALRRLGWVRRRSWQRGAEGFSAIWYPPRPS